MSSSCVLKLLKHEISGPLLLTPVKRIWDSDFGRGKMFLNGTMVYSLPWFLRFVDNNLMLSISTLSYAHGQNRHTYGSMQRLIPCFSIYYQKLLSKSSKSVHRMSIQIWTTCAYWAYAERKCAYGVNECKFNEFLNIGPTLKKSSGYFLVSKSLSQVRNRRQKSHCWAPLLMSSVPDIKRIV